MDTRISQHSTQNGRQNANSRAVPRALSKQSKNSRQQDPIFERPAEEDLDQDSDEKMTDFPISKTKYLVQPDQR